MQRYYKADLSDTLFPLLSEEQSRTIIGNTAGEAPRKGDRPSIMYCHNVLPTELGVKSVGYSELVPAYASIPGGASFSDVRLAFGDHRGRVYLAWDTLGRVYALPQGAPAWLLLPVTVPATGGAGFSAESVTLATVNGVTYIFYSGIGAFIYNEVTFKLDAVPLVGLTISAVLGIVASSGYLVAYTEEAIAWSSTIDPTDFTPSAITGAGGGNVAGIEGPILFATANTLGILVYTYANVVAGTYTGNVQYPFKFREVEGARGGISLDLVAYEATLKSQFIYSKAGLQTITSQSATTILPEVTDFFRRGRFEDFNEGTLSYDITDTTVPLLKKIKHVASRYLVISYGLTSFTHALVYDTALDKLGKLKIDHVDCFALQSTSQDEVISFLRADGSITSLDTRASVASSGVVVVGRFQFVRERLITLLKVECENIDSGASFNLTDYASLDGKNDAPVIGVIDKNVTNLRSFFFKVTAINHSIMLRGQFNLTALQIVYALAGRR